MREETVSTKHVYKGRLLGLEVQEVRLEDGRKALREIVRHGGAVGVLARLPDGRFVFVRQFRKPVEQDLLEIVAGNREPGEEPEACARRELEEETGYRANRLQHLGFIYPSPGYVDERIDLYFAEVGTDAAKAAPDEDEHLQRVLMSRDEFVEQVRRGKVHDAKTLAAWQLYETII